MARNYLTLGKLVMVALALSIPFILYRSLENRLASLKRDAQLQSTFSDERNQMVQQVLEMRLRSEDLAQHTVLERQLPDGPIQGLPQFDAASFLNQAGLSPDPPSQALPPFLQLLNSDDRFFSGMPRRYAGLVELLRQAPLAIGKEAWTRALDVAEQFWVGQDLDNASFTFLIQKLPPGPMASFEAQLCLLGHCDVPPDGRIWLGFRLDRKLKLAALPQAQGSEINRDLQALRLDMALQPWDRWTNLGDLRVSLQSVDLPLEGRIQREWLQHSLLFLILELVCMLIYFILHKYQKVHRLQKQLLAATSHELRTPLAVMRQFSEMLLDRSDRFEPKFRTYHNHIYRECLKLQFLVENLLSAAKFENLQIRPKPVTLELKAWLEDEVHSLQQITDGLKLDLTCPDIEVTWDPGLISQILANLVDNARKHAQTDIMVEVTKSETRIRLSVRDFGTNFDLERIQKVRAFQPHVSKRASLGLGLFLAETMARAHRGSLSFEEASPGLLVILDLDQHLELG